MPRKGFVQKFPYIEMLTKGQVNEIHQSTLKVLKNTGIRFDDADALKLLADNGCIVDFNEKRVRFPENVVMDNLKKTPSTLHVKARDPENDLILEQGKATYFASSIAMQTVDLDTWIPRPATRKEFYDNVRIIDALPNTDAQPSFPFFGFSKVPQCMCLLESNAAKLRLSSKAQMEGSVADNYRFNIAMAEATGQDILQLCNPLAPLTYTEETTKQIFYFADHNMAFHLCPGCLAGASGPATLAGLLITNNAVSLAGIVLAQIYKPGARVWLGSMMMNANMRTGSPCFGDIGNSIMESAFCQMWRYYNLPCWTSAGAWTNSKCIDYQAGYEMTSGALLNALSGSTMVLFQGGLNAELDCHPVKMIIDDDLAGMIKRYGEGMDTSQEALALDVIDEVGPVPGSYLATEHTAEWWRNECYIPAVADRDSLEEWLNKGKKTAIDHAKDKYRTILANHKDTLLPPSQAQAIEDILKEAREYYRSAGFISDEEWKLYQEDINSDNYPFG